MNEITQIKKIATKAAGEHPCFASEIMETARMALAEIADGESAAHELELFADHIAELKEKS